MTCNNKEGNALDAERLLVRMVKSQPRITRKQVCDELEGAGTLASLCTIKHVVHVHELRGCHIRRKPLFQEQHINTRLIFAVEHMDKEKAFWRKILWSEERKWSYLAIMIRNMVEIWWRGGKALTYH